MQRNVLQINDSDHDEYLSYSCDLQTKNLKNKLQKIIADKMSNENEELMTSSFVTNLKNKKTQSTISILNSMRVMLTQKTNVKKTTKWNKTFEEKKTKKTNYIISYRFSNRLFFINHWSNALYFVGAFSTLFFFESKNHVKYREQTISIEAFAEWILIHHIRRYINHFTLNYYCSQSKQIPAS